MTLIVGLEMIINTLPHLNEEQLKDIIIRARALLDIGDTGLENDVNDPDEEMFYDAVVVMFPGKKHAFNFFKKRHIYKMFHKNFAEVQDYVDQNYEELDHDQKLKLNNIMADCLHDYMKKLKMDLTVKSASHQMKKIAMVMERNFPGYAVSGVLGLLLGLRPKP